MATAAKTRTALAVTVPAAFATNIDPVGDGMKVEVTFVSVDDGATSFVLGTTVKVAFMIQL